MGMVAKLLITAVAAPYLAKAVKVARDASEKAAHQLGRWTGEFVKGREEVQEEQKAKSGE